MRETSTLSSDDRAVSDTLGFVLMYSILVVSVGMVATVGVEQLATLRDYEQVNSAERGMEGLAASFDDVYRQSDPHRVAQLAISGGAVFTEQTELKVTHPTPSGGTTTTTVPLNTLEHTIHGETIVYESGAVFRTDPALVRRTPAITCADDVAMVNALHLDVENGGFYNASGGDRITVPIDSRVPSERDVAVVSDEGTKRVEASLDTSTVEFTDWETNAPPSTDTIRLNVSNTASPQAWTALLTETGWAAVSGASHTYECTATHAFVRTVTVDVARDTQ